MRYQTLSLMLILALLVVGCSDGGPVADKPAAPPELSERVAMLMGGWPHAKAITETGEATAFRIMQDPEQSYKEVTLGEGIKLTDAQRAELVGLIGRDEAYGWDFAKGCEPMPGVLVTFEDGATFARLRICFSCKVLGYTPGDWEDFDPVSNEMIDWVKGVFPEDKLIQKLGTDDQEGPL